MDRDLPFRAHPLVSRHTCMMSDRFPACNRNIRSGRYSGFAFAGEIRDYGQGSANHSFHMYHHVKKLMYTVRIGEPDPRFGNMLLEQFGGANGELAAAMQYSIQGLNCDDPERKDLLMDIGTEELSHLEVVGTLARMHLKPHEVGPASRARRSADRDRGRRRSGPVNSVGDAWTADYLKITGELDVDLRSNIAAEARAKIVYERLIDFTDDAGTIDALQFLMTREITHMKAFTLGARKHGQDRHSRSADSAHAGSGRSVLQRLHRHGRSRRTDARGPWNDGGDWQMVDAPAFQELQDPTAGTRLPNELQ